MNTIKAYVLNRNGHIISNMYDQAAIFYTKKGASTILKEMRFIQNMKGVKIIKVKLSIEVTE